MPNSDGITKDVFDALFWKERQLNEGELCETCGTNVATRLCDYELGSGITTSINFQEITKTCDHALCKECATRIWVNCDICPEHANKLRDLLASN